MILGWHKETILQCLPPLPASWSAPKRARPPKYTQLPTESPCLHQTSKFWLKSCLVCEDKMNYFDKIAGSYDDLRGKEILPNVLQSIGEIATKGDLLVDVATGTGLFSVPLAHAGYRVFGIDANLHMLKHASEKALTSHVGFFGAISIAERLPLANLSVSAMLSTNAIHHFRLQRHFREVQRVLKPAGCYLIFTRFRNQNVRSIWGQLFPGFAQKESRLYSPKDFLRLDQEFDQLILEELDELSFAKPFCRKRLLQIARQKKYSTFAMYTQDEFQKAFSAFRESINKYKSQHYTAEIGRLVFRRA